MLGLSGLTVPALKVWFIIFWSLWFTVVWISNIFDALKVANKLPAQWCFASGNYELIVQAVSIYQGSPDWLSGLLYGGVIVWQGLATLLLWVGALSQWSNPGPISAEVVNAAFVVSLGHWMAFMVADELWRQWNLQRAHMLAFICQLGSLAAIHFL